MVSLKEHVDVDIFAESKPSLEDDNGTVAIEVQVMTRPFGNGLLPEITPILPGEIWCKMKSRKAFEDATGTQTGAGEINCSSINQKTIEDAAESLGIDPDFEAIVGDDKAYDTGLEWLKRGSVAIEDQSIESATLVVGDDQSLPEAFRNVVYCKLWSPSRALYYLMTGH